MQRDNQQDNDQVEEPKPRSFSRWAIFRSVGRTLVLLAFCVGTSAVMLALFHPETPLPDQWNPMVPLAVADPVSPLTTWKMRAALSDPLQCREALNTAARAPALDPIEQSENCHVRNRVELSRIGDARIDPIPTSCAVALRMAMWNEHGVQPAAQEFIGSEATIFRQIGSYNCRPIRTSSGNSNRWSTHSTADAIDITGFDFADGRRIRLINDWDGDVDEMAFLRAVRDSACTWFATTLSPDYNSLHADHFHLQARGWGTCR